MSDSSASTSARINVIDDVRSAYPTYQFSYSTQCSNGQCFAHLASITNSIGTAEKYTFAYATSQPLSSPFDSTSYGTWAFLQSAAVTGLGIEHQFQYDGSGEMTQLTTPLGGVMQWAYRSFTYGTSVSLREVQYRYLPMLAGESWFVSGNDSYDETQPFHYYSAITDYGANSYKVWTFYPNSQFYTVPNGGHTVALLTYYTEKFRQHRLRHAAESLLVCSQPATAAIHLLCGKLPRLRHRILRKQVHLYHPNPRHLRKPDPDAGLRLWEHFRHADAYVQFHLRTQPLAVVLRAALHPQPTRVGHSDNQCGNHHAGHQLYDAYPMTTLQPVNSTYLRDPNCANTPYDSTLWFRGNVTQSYTGSTSQNSVYNYYYVTGAVYQAQDSTGNTVTVSLASNDVLPGTLTPNGNSSLANSMTYASSFAVTSVTGANNANSTTTYDAYGRPQSSKSPDGAVTNYTYAYYSSGGQNLQTAIVNNGVANQWKKTVLDGFGRTLSVLTGNGNTTVSETDTQYAPCACSPLGKVSAVSLPYAPGQTPVWTRYTSRASGRTLTIVKPDGASTTTYAYAGNQTTVTDPAGKWTTFTSDVFGNLITVTEPDFSGNGGGPVATNYTYNSANQLTLVSMPRGVTQTRSFQWTGSDLTSTTNPENGTVAYTYDSAHHVLTRLDAKGRQDQLHLRHLRPPHPGQAPGIGDGGPHPTD